jgi:hypothetical protein
MEILVCVIPSTNDMMLKCKFKWRARADEVMDV